MFSLPYPKAILKTVGIAVFSATHGLAAPPPNAPSTPEKYYGPPEIEMSSQGGRMAVYRQKGMNVVVLTPKGAKAPTFMSFIKDDGEFTGADTSKFLSDFASKTKTEWVNLDPNMVGASLRFFVEAPSSAPDLTKQKTSESKDPAAAEKAWREFSKDPEVIGDVEAVSKMMMSQRRIWISKDKNFLAAVSGDGRSLGIAYLGKNEKSPHR